MTQKSELILVKSFDKFISMRLKFLKTAIEKIFRSHLKNKVLYHLRIRIAKCKILFYEMASSQNGRALLKCMQHFKRAGRVHFE